MSDDSPEMSASHRAEYPSPSPASRKENRNADLFRPHPAQYASFSFSKARRMFSFSSSPKYVLRIHHGAVLKGMGIELKAESEHKYRCIRMTRVLLAWDSVEAEGLLMRRQSSQVSGGAPSQESMDDDTYATASSPVDSSSGTHEAVYGDTGQDAGDEVRFSIEWTRIDRLKDTYSLDIHRLKGNLRSYKFLYDTIRERADLQR
ncbi:hypothetical protein EDB19DRAFT_2039019 [Suillus lakei]|nr:hypothetical protein EDB19DRAFT_2039019 [Suillus lakei]